jgi:hypothetical protein
MCRRNRLMIADVAWWWEKRHRRYTPSVARALQAVEIARARNNCQAIHHARLRLRAARIEGLREGLSR